jgi:hypothetical protein
MRLAVAILTGCAFDAEFAPAHRRIAERADYRVGVGFHFELDKTEALALTALAVAHDLRFPDGGMRRDQIAQFTIAAIEGQISDE